MGEVPAGCPGRADSSRALTSATSLDRMAFPPEERHLRFAKSRSNTVNPFDTQQNVELGTAMPVGRAPMSAAVVAVPVAVAVPTPSLTPVVAPTTPVNCWRHRCRWRKEGGGRSKMANVNREIHLKSRPTGAPTEANFELVETPIPRPGPGQFLVRNIWMSVDPYMRGRMMDRESYVPPFQVGAPLDGGSVGQVVESKLDGFAAGDYVCGFATGGWREYYVSEGVMTQKIDPAAAPLQSYLGVMGMPGMTAYTSLLRIGEPKAGETVFVSAAAGAVGSVVCQIAKLKGCRVVGSAGSDDKIRWLLGEAGIDAAVNYRTCGDLHTAVSEACPQGIDIYYENVGGAHLEVALELMNKYGRVVMCGMISTYNSVEPPPGPRNLIHVVAKSLKMHGFIVTDFLDMAPQFFADMGAWIRTGKIKWRETVVDGIENAPRAFLGLFKGDNIGKMLVRLAPE